MHWETNKKSFFELKSLHQTDHEQRFFTINVFLENKTEVFASIFDCIQKLWNAPAHRASLVDLARI